jgi:hypothetical protein
MGCFKHMRWLSLAWLEARRSAVSTQIWLDGAEVRGRGYTGAHDAKRLESILDVRLYHRAPGSARWDLMQSGRSPELKEGFATQGVSISADVIAGTWMVVARLDLRESERSGWRSYVRRSRVRVPRNYAFLPDEG